MKYEKILLAVPTQACPDIPLPEDEQKSRYERRRYCFFAAQKMTLGGEDFLGVTVFDRNKKPLRRWWLTSRQSGMQAFEQVKSNYNRRYERETRHMYETAIDTELHTGPLWSYTRDVLVGTDEDRRLVQSFIGTAEDDVGDAIATFQQAQREVKREKKREAKRSVIRRRFAELPPLPEDLDRWICDGPLLPYRYFYYTYTGKPAQEGICTHCGVESKLENVRTGAQVRCPACGSMLRCRSKKRLPTYGVTDHGKAVLYQQAGDELAVRVFEVRAEIRYDDLTGTVDRQQCKVEIYRYYLEKKGKQAVAAYSRYYGRPSVEVDGFRECGEGYGVADAYVYPGGLEEIRRGLGIWTPVEVMAQHGLHCEPDTMWRKLLARPELEYLVKLGLYNLANWEMTESWVRGGSSSALLRGTGIAGVLGVDKTTVQLLQQADAGGDTLQVVRWLEKNGIRLRAEDIADVERLRLRSEGNASILQRMAEAGSIHKALRYIGQQVSARDDGGHVLTLWRDYVTMAKGIGIDLTDGMRLFPRKLRRAHDEAVKLAEMRKNAAIDAGIAKTAAALEDLSWETKTLLIRPARSAGELFLEGKHLSHCVGRSHYAQSMAEGKTAILFIRKKREPDVPYVTLELGLQAWNKLQCYGAGDSWPGKSVDHFVSEWLKSVVHPARKQVKGERTA